MSLSIEAINDLALNINDEHTVEDNATANTATGNILNIVADVIAKRCHVYFWCHHEYRQLYKPSNPNAEDEKVVAEVCETFNANVGKAVAFLLAYMDSLGLANEQLKFILNNNDLKICPKIPSNKRVRTRIVNICIFVRFHEFFPLFSSCNYFRRPRRRS